MNQNKQQWIAIGEAITPALIEMEDLLWDYEANVGRQPKYPIEGFRASFKIFMSAFIDKIYQLQEDEDIDQEERIKMGVKAMEEVRKLVKVYTDIDTHRLYDDI